MILQVPLDLPLTVKILLLEDFQDFTESPFASLVTLSLEVDCFTFKVTVEALRVAFGASFLPTFLVSLLLHAEHFLV